MILDDILKLFGIVGLIAVGGLTRDGLNSLVYYARNKRWPPLLSTVEQDCATKINASELEALEQKNAELRARLLEANNDLNVLWQKTLDKL